MELASSGLAAPMKERGLIDENPGADAFLQAFIMIVVSEIGERGLDFFAVLHAEDFS